MRRPRGKVLVLGADCRSFLSVVRSLGRYGLEVHTAWCPTGHPALTSRYVHVHHDLPLPFAEPGGANLGASPATSLGEFETLLNRESFDLVIPCNDPSILPLYAHRRRLCESARIYLLNDRAHEVACSKEHTLALARELGVPVPRSEYVSAVGALQRPAHDYELPVVVKPVTSFTLGELSARRQVIKIYRREELVPRLEAELSAGPVILQENFVGVGIGVEVLADKGVLRTVFQHERVHEPLHGGASSYRRSTPVHPALRAAAQEMAAALGYHGVGMFEFKLNRATGQWVLLEINGRFWGSLPLALYAGADFPTYLYQMLIEERHEFPEAYRVGVYCRNLVADLEWVRENLRADKHDPTLATRPMSRVFLELGNVLLLREASDTFVKDDPRPGFAELRSWLFEKAAGAARRLRYAWKRSPLMRRYLGRGAQRALADARSVAFVCYGNICRSPFAAAYARRILPDRMSVASGGTGVDERTAKRSSPGEAQAVARTYQVELRSHTAARASDALILGTDLIFVFDAANLETVRTRWPAASSKVHLLGALVPAGPLLINDPYGRGTEEFSRVFSEIAKALDEGVRRFPPQSRRP